MARIAYQWAMLAKTLDQALDFTILPGYTSLGYRLRERLVARGPLELSHRSVIVTGASSGIGEAASAGLARAGATVHMLVRNPDKGQVSLNRVRDAVDGADLHLHRCDISDLDSVRDFAAAFRKRGEPLGALINNAGVLPPKRTASAQGFELTFATNVLGPFLLTALLLPALRDGAPSRVINVSSGGMYSAKVDLDDLQLAKHEFDGTRAYAHTKRIEVALSDEWDRRLERDGIDVHSTHPGWVATAGLSESLPRFEQVLKPLLRDPDQGADTIVWLAGSPSAVGRGGEFWHDRRPRPKHRVPWTRETSEERSELFDECERMCGLVGGGATTADPALAAADPG